MASRIIDVVFDMETQDPDDFLCLLFLASHPRVNLKAVTIVPGSREQVGLVRWALGALGLDKLPVGAGNIDHPKPSVSPWHYQAYRALFPNATSVPSSADAEEAWRVLVRECDENTVLFTGGPLTNLATAIDEGQADFVAGCWLGQGGFAGDNVVALEHRLPKFVGRTHMQTFNFMSNLPAARACLAHGGFRRIRLVSKNVCHAESNRFGPEQLARLEARLAAAAGGHGPAAACHQAGLELLAVGMRHYLKRHPSGKLFHDPLAAACILDRRVVDWCEVVLSEDNRHAWGSKPRHGSGTFISTRHTPDVFWAVLLDDGRPSGGGKVAGASSAEDAVSDGVGAASAPPAAAVAATVASTSAAAQPPPVPAGADTEKGEAVASVEAELQEWARDWEGSTLPPFAQPARPAQSEGGDALEGLASDPAARPERVLFSTAHCVVAYDVFPKARVHVLILPRAPLAKPQELREEHAPLLRHMLRLAEWLAPRLRAQHPGLPPLRCGFHAVPSMRQLHLHLISLDFASAEVKRPRHWIIFNTDYLVPPWKWATMLEQHGRVHVDRAAEEAKLKMPMVCPLTGVALESMEAVREHVRSSTYGYAVGATARDLHFGCSPSEMNGSRRVPE